MNRGAPNGGVSAFERLAAPPASLVPSAWSIRMSGWSSRALRAGLGYSIDGGMAPKTAVLAD